MQKKFFSWILLIIGMLVIHGYGYDETLIPIPSQQQEVAKSLSANQYYSKRDIDSQKKEQKLLSGYSQPARINVKGDWDFFLTGDFIYWQAKEEGFEIARLIKISGDFDQGFVETSEFIEIDFDYHPGFKIGAGMHFNRDHWTLFAEYTRLTTKDSRKTDVLPWDTLSYEYFEPIWSTVTADVYFVKGVWRLQHNILDVGIGRSYYSGEKVTFQPYFGIRAGWIDQKFQTLDIENFLSRVFTPLVRTSENKSSSWLLGTRAGVESQWLLGKGIRFFGNVAASLFYQRIDAEVNLKRKEQEIELVILSSLNTAEEKKGMINPNVELNAGFGWGRYFDCEKWHIDLAVSYDFQIFWHQNMMRAILDNLFTFDDPRAGNLMMQGLIVALRVDF